MGVWRHPATLSPEKRGLHVPLTSRYTQMAKDSLSTTSPCLNVGSSGNRQRYSVYVKCCRSYIRVNGAEMRSLRSGWGWLPVPSGSASSPPHTCALLYRKRAVCGESPAGSSPPERPGLSNTEEIPSPSTAACLQPCFTPTDTEHSEECRKAGKLDFGPLCPFAPDRSTRAWIGEAQITPSTSERDVHFRF